jgi:WhiB family redox-sensing transcriptional regulator
VTGRQPRHRGPVAPAPFVARWRELAACRGADLNLFFPGRGESAGPARRVCAGCPVREPCLDYALGNAISYGVWGGLAERDRRALRSRRIGAARRERDAAIAAAAAAGDSQAAIGRAFGLTRTSVGRVLSGGADERDRS